MRHRQSWRYPWNGLIQLVSGRDETGRRAATCRAAWRAECGNQMLGLLIPDCPLHNLVHLFQHHQTFTGRQSDEGVWMGLDVSDELGIENEGLTVELC